MKKTINKIILTTLIITSLLITGCYEEEDCIQLGNITDFQISVINWGQDKAKVELDTNKSIVISGDHKVEKLETGKPIYKCNIGTFNDPVYIYVLK